MEKGSKNCTVKFYLKDSGKHDPKGLQIFGRITLDRKKAEFFTGEHTPPEKWNESAGMPKRNPRLEEYLISIKEKIHSHKRELEYQKFEVDAKALRDFHKNGVRKDVKPGFLAYFDGCIGKFKNLPGEITSVTLMKYSTVRNQLGLFLQSKGKRDIPIDGLTPGLVLEFEHFLLTTPSQQYGKPVARNTANDYHKKIKKVIHLAMKEKLLAESPYANLKMRHDPVNREFLTKDELARLAAHPLGDNLSLDRVRDIFVFSCYTGLRYQDAQNLQADNVTIDSEKNYWLTFEQQKTGKREMLPMFDQAIAIYHKYDRSREITGDVLPRLSNAKTNLYLKTVADLVGIRKKITHHIARHTFATTVTLSNDMPLEMVSTFLGHTDLKTTRIYAKLTPEYKLRMAKFVNQKLNPSHDER